MEEEKGEESEKIEGKEWEGDGRVGEVQDREWEKTKERGMEKEKEMGGMGIGEGK